MHWHQILIKPLITEKSTASQEDSETRYKCYPFEVNLHATKDEVKKAVEQMALEMYDKTVKVHRVNTVRVHAKWRRRGTKIGSTRESKKALVFIPRAQALEIF